MTRLLLVRHGESTWNAARRWQGWADAPLSDLGRRQAEEACDAVRGDVAAVVTSDLERARETGEIIAAALGLGPVTVEADLRERDVGQLTGLTRDEIDERWPGLLAGGTGAWDPPGGEPAAHVTERALAAVRRVAGAHPGDGVLVVTHGGVVRNLERHLGETPQPLPNLGGAWFEVDGERLAVGPRLLLLDPEEVTVTVPRQL